MNILDKTIELYEHYNSTCIIDTDKLTIENPDCETLHFRNDLELMDFLLTETILSGSMEI